ncbi:MCP four helix bundle domain-containing protein, partial [Thermomicrobium sp. CFH 73360]|uniref:MCP four helix bundle domain-containing protein n=1 Tax=Thermomicrobium sp. CFH 73360 TaxID=2951987 RepID=UPI0020775CB1
MTLSFRAKVLGILASLATVLLGITLVGWFWIDGILDTVDESRQSSQFLVQLAKTTRDMTELRAQTLAALSVSSDTTVRQRIEDRIAELDTAITDGLQALERLAPSGQVSDVAALRSDWQTYRSAAELTLQALQRGDALGAQQNVTANSTPKFTQLVQTIARLENGVDQQVSASSQIAVSELTNFRYAMVGAAGL